MNLGSGFPALSKRGSVIASEEGRWQRMANDLERNLHFLKQQHRETLAQLHLEVDSLKRKNKEFEEKEMEDRRESDEGEEEEKEDEFGAKAAIENPLKESFKREPDVVERSSPPSPASPSPQTDPCPLTQKLPRASSNPFLANILPSRSRKPPSLEESEAVIRQLWNINHMQMQELIYLRSCLEDIYRTKRIPEDYTQLSGRFGSSQTSRFPKVKNSPKQCRMLTPLLPAPPLAERAVLPALKQTLGNAFGDRQKRAQALHRKRVGRNTTAL
ncbi:coiled-coil domain-containing protein 74B-like isoform X3 [Anolis sagrei]|uniref:coiled-coil domain-containing protein 74B-like isoform X3 n=1 Tax=Anolis sagrei TaxID=38937 RepID=UPI00352133B2